jgi:nicotinamidase-related amidase
MLRLDDTILLVIDIQEPLFPKEGQAAELLVRNSRRLIQGCKTLSAPILVTEQYPQGLGGTHAPLLEHLEGVLKLPKLEFSCMANAPFRSALEATGKNQLLVTGMETHVCVLQTILEAHQLGYEVFVVRDAVLSTLPEQHIAGLERIAHAGATLVTTQMALFELLRVAGTPLFKKMLPLLKEESPHDNTPEA